MKAIFLDIDGVLQPKNSKGRFEHIKEVPSLAKELTQKLGNGFDYYKALGDNSGMRGIVPYFDYDIAAVYWDWNPDAVRLLHQVIDETGAKIVLSTDWRERGNEVMKALLDIHDFGKYLYGSTYFTANFAAQNIKEKFDYNELSQMHDDWGKQMRKLCNSFEEIYPPEGSGWGQRSFDFRSAEIWEYLDRHQEITDYVVIDDSDLRIGLKNHFVLSHDGYMQEKEAEAMIQALSLNDGPYYIPQEFKDEDFIAWREKWIYNSCYYY